jgi:hypothetical protein
MTVPMLDTFDTNNTALPSGERTVTTVAPQALMLMNDRFVHERAEGFARRIVEEVGDDPLRQVEKAYELALSRKPTERERGIAMEYVRRQASAYEALRKRLRFEPDVPSSVYSGYLKKLGAGDLLVGPRGGWKYARGVWGGGYEGILSVEPMQGPCALAEGTKFLDGSVQGKILIQNGCEVAGLMARAKLGGEELGAGYDLVIAPKADSVMIRRHEKKGVKVLAAAGLPIESGAWYGLKLEVKGPRIVGYVDGKRVLVAEDPAPLGEGEAGVRVWGAAMAIEGMAVWRGGNAEPVYDGRNWGAREKALAALGVVLFNLNEFVYVD